MIVDARWAGIFQHNHLQGLQRKCPTDARKKWLDCFELTERQNERSQFLPHFV